MNCFHRKYKTDIPIRVHGMGNFFSIFYKLYMKRLCSARFGSVRVLGKTKHVHCMEKTQ